jgi:hypothetical protein
MKIERAWWMLLLTLLFSVMISAQDKTGVPLTVTVSVKAGHGNDVPAISPEDLKLYENRKLIEITNLVPLQGEQAAVQVYFLIDESFDRNVGAALGDLPQFIYSLPPNISVAVGYISHGHAQMVQEPTLDHLQAAKSVRAPRGGSTGASPFAAVTELIRTWQDSTTRREIFLISAGQDPTQYGSSNYAQEEAIDAAQRAAVPVNVITLGIGWNATWLQELAKRSGGEAYSGNFVGPINFAPAFQAFAARLAHQYRLTFMVQSQSKGGFQSIKLETSTKNAKLLVADRVYVPAVK